MKVLALSGGKDSMACLFLKRDEIDCAVFVSTGYAYPETLAMIDYAATLVPVRVLHQDRRAQWAACGIPADVVPVEWTVEGQACTTPKSATIQASFHCCLQNIGRPLFTAAQEMGAATVICGQRNEETRKSAVRHGHTEHGITREHPIEDWTTAQVMEYLARHMEIPPHFALRHSSLDCYDCPAYARESQDKWDWTARAHPDFYEAMRRHREAVHTAAVTALQDGGLRCYPR